MGKSIRGLLFGVSPSSKYMEAVDLLRNKKYIKEVKLTYGMYDFVAIIEASTMDDYIKYVKDVERLVSDDGAIIYLRILPVAEYREK